VWTKIGIETDRGPWVAALVASGYQVYAINPLQSARARQGNGVSGSKSDAGDAHVLADLVRTRCHQLRTVAGPVLTRLNASRHRIRVLLPIRESHKHPHQQSASRQDAGLVALVAAVTTVNTRR